MILPLVMVALFFLIVILGRIKDNWNGKSDFREVILDGEKLMLVAISPERKMVNEITIAGQTELWIPGGKGWYRVEVIKKILEQEHREGDLKRIVFYNFGFIPDRTLITSEANDWDAQGSLIESLGLIGWWKYRMIEGQVLVRGEKLTGEDLKTGVALDELMPRDMADSEILTDETSISVVNASGNDGLAKFVAKRLEWAGTGVASVENGEVEEGGCRVSWPKEKKSGLWWQEFWETMGCKVNKSGGNSEMVEVTLGKSYDEMIKYSSYPR